MLITKTNPTGADWYIQELQTKLHTKLLVEWNISSDDYKCYGRCYRNKSDDGYIAQNYEASNEYKEVYWDDTLKAISFFGVGNTANLSVGANANVHLVFFVNLAALAPAISHRADEEVRQQVLNAIGSNAFGFSVDSVETSIENVLREYSGSRRDERLKYVDMHPIHCFRINLTLNYNVNKNC